MNIRDKIDPATLEYLDGIAQIVARLYQEDMSADKLGEEPGELQKAVYSLGQAYMLLYNELLNNAEVEEVEVEQKAE